jgi:HSP20 family protein
MANRQQGDSSAGRGRKQQGQTASGTTSGGRADQSASGAARETDRGDSGTSTGRNVSRQDQEQERSVSREPGMQATQRGARGGITRQQPSSPGLFAAPPGLLAGAFMADPFEFMRRMTADLDRVFEETGFGALEPSGGSTTGRGLTGGLGAGRSTTAWVPQVETYQRGNELVLRADLPGVKKEDIHVDVEDGILTISGERQQQNEERQEGFYRREQSYGTFFRALPLPDGVDEDRIKATCENGVLEVTVPVPEQRRRGGKRVEIG